MIKCLMTEFESSLLTEQEWSLEANRIVAQ